MSIPEFKSLNNLSKNYVKPKQKVFVYTPGSAPKIPDSLLRKRETPPAAVASVQKPVASSVTTAKQPAPKPVAKTPVGNSKFIYYTILSGDNLWDLADHFNVTVAQIKKLNGINNASYLKPGQKIKIPK